MFSLKQKTINSYSERAGLNTNDTTAINRSKRAKLAVRPEWSTLSPVNYSNASQLWASVSLSIKTITHNVTQ